MITSIESAVQGFLELLYPPVCLACDRAVPAGTQLLCGRCRELLAGDTAHRCRVCAHPLHRPGPVCRPCIESRPSFFRAHCLGDYAGPLKQAVRAFKFGGNLSLGRLLGDLLAGRVFAAVGSVDRVIPVPMTRRKERLRGFSPTRILAREVARWGGLGRESEALRRTGADVPLTSRCRLDRQQQILDSYHLVDDLDLSGERVLLIDDVLTTGATSRNLATILRGQGGARKVHVAVLARTVADS